MQNICSFFSISLSLFVVICVDGLVKLGNFYSSLYMKSYSAVEPSWLDSLLVKS